MDAHWTASVTLRCNCQLTSGVKEVFDCAVNSHLVFLIDLVEEGEGEFYVFDVMKGDGLLLDFI
jgi:hypothetical protein